MRSRRSPVYGLPTLGGESLKQFADLTIPEFLAFASRLHAPTTSLRVAVLTSVWQCYRKDLQEKSAAGAAGWQIIDQDVRFISHSQDAIALVQTGDVDVAIVSYAAELKLPPSIEISSPWHVEPMAMVMSATAGLPENERLGDLALLKKYGIVMFERGYGIRDRSVDPYFEKLDISIRPVAELRTVAEIKDLVARTPDFVTILPIPTVQHDIRLDYVELDGITARDIHFIARKPHSPTVAKFLDSFREVTG